MGKGITAHASIWTHAIAFQRMFCTASRCPAGPNSLGDLFHVKPQLLGKISGVIFALFHVSVSCTRWKKKLCHNEKYNKKRIERRRRETCGCHDGFCVEIHRVIMFCCDYLLFFPLLLLQVWRVGVFLPLNLEPQPSRRCSFLAAWNSNLKLNEAASKLET